MNVQQAIEIIEGKADLANRLHEVREENQRLRTALEDLYDDISEYQRRNHLGGHDNHAMKQARAALGRSKIE